jgi:hypothetical protein
MCTGGEGQTDYNVYKSGIIMCTGGEGQADYNVYKGGPDYNVDKL